MENHKIYKLKSVNEFAHYLEYIIVHLTTKIRRFERYLAEMGLILRDAISFDGLIQCLEANKDFNVAPVCNIEIYVDKLPSEIYEDYMDLTTSVGIGILNLISDTQGSSVSYHLFRKLLAKSAFAYKLNPLEDDYKKIMDHCRDFRNWSAHVPQSLINAQFAALKKIDKKAKEMVLQTKDIIKVPVFETHDTEYFVKLYMDCYMSSKLFNHLLLRILKDYQSFTGKESSVDLAIYQNRDINIDYEIQDISLKMNQRKYNP